MIWQPREAQAVWDIWDIVRAIGWTLRAFRACSSALQRGQFFQDFIPRLQRKERDGKHGEQGGSERTSTGTLPCSRHGHTTPPPGATSATWAQTVLRWHWSGFSSKDPSTSPSLTPARSQHPAEHPGVQGTHHRPTAFFQEPGRHQAPPAAGAPAAVPWPAQNRSTT